jgi:hypothetical protein
MRADTVDAVQPPSTGTPRCIHGHVVKRPRQLRLVMDARERAVRVQKLDGGAMAEVGSVLARVAR